MILFSKKLTEEEAEQVYLLLEAGRRVRIITIPFKSSVLSLLLIILVAIVAAFSVTVHTNQVIARKASRVTCSSFENAPNPQLTAQNALNAARQSGDPVQWKIYKGLDANKDGIACNDLK